MTKRVDAAEREGVVLGAWHICLIILGEVRWQGHVFHPKVCLRVLSQHHECYRKHLSPPERAHIVWDDLEASHFLLCEILEATQSIKDCPIRIELITLKTRWRVLLSGI
jgi:hypothetical protein